MATLGKILRWFFGLNGLLFGSLVATFLWFAPQLLWRGMHSSNPDSRLIFGSPAGSAVVIPRFLVVVLLAVVFSMAWWTLGKGTRTARGWAIAASVALIPSVWIRPVLTIWTGAGVLGLIVFCRRKTVEEVGARPAKAARIRGDGTNTALDWLCTTVAWAGVLGGGALWSNWGRQHGLPTNEDFEERLLLILGASFIATAVHELGHAVAALAVEMKIRQLVLGPFNCRVRNGKWQCRFSPAGLLSVGGAVGTTPMRMDDYRWRMMAVVAAGPLASICLGVLALWATWNAKDLGWEPCWKLFSYLTTFSALGFALNLIPTLPGSSYSDGARIYQLLAGGPASQVEHAFAMISSTAVSPLRPGNLDMHLIQRALGFCKTGERALVLRVNAFQCFLDSGQIPQALEVLADAEGVYTASSGAIPAELKAMVHRAFTFANAFVRRDAGAARSWWDRTTGRRAESFTVDDWKAYCSLMWIENRPEEARDAWERGNALAQGCPAAGAYDYDRDCFARLRSELEAVAA